MVSKCNRGHERTVYPSGRVRCRICENAGQARAFHRNPRVTKAKTKAAYARNRDKLKAQRDAWRAVNPPKKRAFPYISPEEKYARKLAARKKTYEKNKAKVLAQAAIYRTAHKEEERAARKAHYQRNKDRVLEIAAAYRRAIKKRAIPAWADLSKIAEIYDAAAWITEQSGEPFEVDHIVPLNSPHVRGLHCEANLEILPASENRSKSNSWWPDN